MLCLAAPHLAEGQTGEENVLPAAEVTALLHAPFTAGLKHQKLDSLSLQLQRGQTLASLLQQRTPIYLREYGPGQLSTISFRGTGSSHTAVLWNGLNLNSPTLGQTDFSQLPVFALEGVQVQWGSSSALYGSDALGGTIQLQTRPQHWQQGWGLRARQEAGSFGARFSGLAGQWTRQRWQTDLRLYRQSADNDFPYTNTLLRTRPREQNTHSAFWQEGVVAQLGFKPAAEREWGLQSWWNRSWRQIQPPMGSIMGTDEQQQEALRLNLQYKQVVKQGQWQAQLGWLSDELVYNGAQFISRQLIAKSDWEQDLGPSWRLQAGGQWSRRQATNANYEAAEIRLESFALLRWQPHSRWTNTFTIRQVLADGAWAPLAPSLGSEAGLFSFLTLKAAAGRHYRLPTLNDRFWPWFGKPELKAEQGWHAEGGLATNALPLFGGKAKAEATRYWLLIDDWILWLPTVVPGPDGEPLSGWGPRNIQQVYSRGWEGNLDWQHAGGWSLGTNAAYTRTENRLALHAFDRTAGRQLPFTPYWKAGGWLRWHRKGWLAELNHTYVGRRFTTGEEDPFNSLPPFWLLDLSAGKQLQWRRHSVSLLLQARNVLDHQYQNYERRPMPGRHYNLSITYSILSPTP
ncbi:TonB-dependent receptor [Cesiribacter andamanensis]|uniref:TonB-dependent receptor n=1 Tax=Cesiribacter andamanensis TaxID=649507 RepID=UPI00058C41AF|nr:TonB-dependent receptor plug domain-containing protein [Cesiribacter andamanensis]